jgi:hypothetical protein
VCQQVYHQEWFMESTVMDGLRIAKAANKSDIIKDRNRC